MKYISLILLLTIWIIMGISCKQEKEKVKQKYFVLSDKNNWKISFTIENGDTIFSDPPPPPPPNMKWYSNYVFIMDSTDLVYIYQTENKDIDNINYYSYNSIFQNNTKTHDNLIYEYDFPNYIGLRPEYMIAIESKNLLSFIKLNNDIFQLDSNKSPFVIIYIASNKDTIMNPAYYDLKKLIPSRDQRKCLIAFITRKTTEEEDWVIYYKRRNMEYIPENINWTTHFINEKTKPFTKEYNKIEQRTIGIIKAKAAFKINWFKNAGYRLD
jgi:hypothetical protein